MKRVTFALVALLACGAFASRAQTTMSGARGTASAPPGGGGVSSLSTISDATMPGTWSGEWSDGFLSGVYTSPNGEDSITSNGSRGVWNAVAEQIDYYGHGHSGFRSGMLKFVDSTHTWSVDFTNVPLPDAIMDSNAHQFTGFAGDSQTGRLYYIAGNGGGDGVYRREPGTPSWTSMGIGPEGNHGQVPGAAFMPTWGSSGSFVNGSLYGVVRYDVARNSTTLIWDYDGDGDDPDHLHSSGQSQAWYDPRANAVYISGGDKATVKVTSTGHSNVGDTPVGVFLGQAGSTYGVVADGYTSTHPLTKGRVRRPLLIQPNVNMWRQDGDSTWTALGVTPPNSPLSNNAWFVVAVSDYDCIVMWVQTNTSQNGDMKAYVYRHATADER